MSFSRENMTFEAHSPVVLSLRIIPGGSCKSLRRHLKPYCRNIACTLLIGTLSTALDSKSLPQMISLGVHLSMVTFQPPMNHTFMVSFSVKDSIEILR